MSRTCLQWLIISLLLVNFSTVVYAQNDANNDHRLIELNDDFWVEDESIRLEQFQSMSFRRSSEGYFEEKYTEYKCESNRNEGVDNVDYHKLERSYLEYDDGLQETFEENTNTSGLPSSNELEGQVAYTYSMTNQSPLVWSSSLPAQSCGLPLNRQGSESVESKDGYMWRKYDTTELLGVYRKVGPQPICVKPVMTIHIISPEQPLGTQPIEAALHPRWVSNGRQVKIVGRYKGTVIDYLLKSYSAVQWTTRILPSDKCSEKSKPKFNF